MEPVARALNGALVPIEVQTHEQLDGAVAKLRRVAVLWDASNPTNPIQLKDAEEAARTLGLQTQPVPVRGPNDFDTAS